MAQLFPGKYVLCMRFPEVGQSWEGKCVVVRYIHIYIYEGRIEVVSYYEEVVKEKIDFLLKNSGNQVSPYSPI